MSLTLADAKKLIAGAEATAVAMERNVSIVVVDSRAVPLMMQRMDGAFWGTPGIATAKARTSVDMNADSGSLAGLKADLPGVWSLIESQVAYPITSLGGGLVIHVDGQVVGAIAVSGASEDEDIAIATAGIAAWQS